MQHKKVLKATGEFLKEKMGYDFVNLVTKLAVFYVISFLISKYMEAVIYFQGGLSTIAGFFGIKMAQADQLPRQWVELFIDVNQKTVSSTPVGEGKFNPEGWDKPYDYGSLEHQEAEPYLFPQKEQKFKFWDLINAIAVLYIGWEAYKYYKNAQLSDKGVDYLTMAIFSLLVLMIGVLSFSKFLGRFSFNKFQEENR
tara:strand:- start:343 stop:933 length:591 start_codon:yes stop_codon:yes gene_type:complete